MQGCRAWGRLEGGTLILLVEMKIGPATMEIIMEVPQNTRDRTTVGPCYTIPGYVTKDSCQHTTQMLACECSLQHFIVAVMKSA